MRTLKACLPPLLALFALPGAQAIGLGGLKVDSAQGRPLNATVDLYLGPEENLAGWEPMLLQDYFGDGLETPASLLDTIRARLTRGGDGRAYVRLETTGPVNLAHFSFRLKLMQETQGIVSRYEINLPAQPLALAAPLQPRAPRKLRHRRPAPVSRATATDFAGGYGPVQPGESLWTIARRLGPVSEVHRLMDQLYEANPHAFVGGNRNRLRTGVRLATSRLASGTAPAQPATGDATPMTPGRLTEAPQPPVAVVPTAPVLRQEIETALATARPLSDRDPELAARLAALDRKFAALRAQYGEAQARTTAALAVSPAESEPAATTSPPAPLAARPAAREQAEPAPRVIPPAPTRPASEGMDWSFPLLSSAVVLALALGALTARQRRPQNMPSIQPIPPLRNKSDDALRAEVSRKTSNRLRLEKEIQAMAEPAATRPAPPSKTVANPQAPTLPPMPSAVAPLEISASIDSCIAHGNYEEAENLLRRLIDDQPRNIAAKLRLGEVLYITEHAEAFVTLVEEIKRLHRRDLADDDWARLLRMGKIIAPDAQMFSGPKPVGQRA